VLKPGLEHEAAVFNESSKSTADWRRVLPSKFFVVFETITIVPFGHGQAR
jgi:hypothetical protein